MHELIIETIARGGYVGIALLMAIWNVLLILGGQWLATYLEESQDVIGWIILGFLGLGLVGYVWRLLTWKPRVREVD